MLAAVGLGCLALATSAAGAPDVGLEVPAPGGLSVTQLRVAARGPDARPPLPRLGVRGARVAAPSSLTVVGGVVRDPRRPRRATVSLVVARASGAAPAPGDLRLRLAGRAGWRALRASEATLDPASLARGDAGAPARGVRSLARATPVALLAGRRLRTPGPQRLARIAFALARRPGAASAPLLASRVGRALGLALPPIARRGFPLSRPAAAPPVAPGRCPAPPSFVALQSPAAAEGLISRGAPGLPGLAARGVPHSMLSGVDPARQAAIVWGYDLVGLSGEEMAARLRAAMASVPSHQVVLDRVEGARWSDGPPAEPPVVDPRSAGVALVQAMASLAAQSPWGGTYAERVHFWIGPGLHSAVGAGLGPNHNLGRDGRVHRRTYDQALRAMAGGGGAWMQMFHEPWLAHVPAEPFTAEEWVRWPTRFAEVFTRLGGRVERLHFLLSQAEQAPPGALPPGADGSPMGATFALARQPGTNLQILCNGPGALNVESQAGAWLSSLDAAFRPG